MARAISPRLLAVVEALPLVAGLRVLEIGGAPGAGAREVAARVAPGGHVLVIDRSQSAVARTRVNCEAEVEAGLLSTLCAPSRISTCPPMSDFSISPSPAVSALLTGGIRGSTTTPCAT